MRRLFRTVRHRWRALLITTTGLASIVSFGIVSVVINGQPSTRPFNGWLAVLQPTYSARDDQVGLVVTPAVPGAPGQHPVLVYTVFACGTHPFQGVLLIGADARLSNMRPVFPAISDQSDASPSYIPDLVMSNDGTGQSLDVGPVQVLRINLTHVSACPPATTSADLLGGEAVSFTGSARASIQRNWSLGWWEAPRDSQSWPLVGSLPGVSPNLSGSFEASAALPGSWSRPPAERFEVNVGGLTAKASIDAAFPASTDPAGLGWALSTPFQATARVTNSESMSRWQQALVAAGIFLGLGGGLLASQLFEWSRSQGGDETPPGPPPDVPAHPSLDLSISEPETPAPPPSPKLPSRSRFLPGVAIGLAAALLVTKSRANRSK